ncbi:MAG: metallophosphoesterase [Candidatus Methanomethylicia archaeon]
MRIGILSDSHDNLVNIEKAVKTLNQFSIDLAIHLGDYIAPFSIRRIGELLKTRLIGVFGNNDGDKYLILSNAKTYGFEIYDSPYMLNIDGYSILAMHGYSSKEFTKSLIHSLCLSGKYDVIMYGHTHEVHIEKIGKSLIINPGEVFGYLSGNASIAVLDLDGLKTEIVKL